MTVNLSALAGAGQQFFDNTGVPLTGGKLYSYAAGTTTPQTTYTNASGSTAHTNPIILDSAGRISTGEIWLTAGSNYKFVLKTSADITLATWDNITGINDIGITLNASNVIYDPAGTGAVSTTVQAKLREYVNVLDFGADPTGATDSTSAMQLAHNTGKYVLYPEGTYLFSRITGTTGGIIGQGLRTILLTNDTTSGNVIDFVSLAPNTGTLAINNSVMMFRDFYLGTSTYTDAQKTSGNGIKISAPFYEEFFVHFDNVSIRYLPNQIYLTNTTFYRITNCNFFFYSGNAIYTDEPISTDNGENGIFGCSFFNGLGYNLSSSAVYAYSGGMKFSNNKINGGGVGYTQAALDAAGTSILLINGNSFENMTTCVEFVKPSGTGSFNQITMVGNQFNPVVTGIKIGSYSAGTFEILSITGNVFLLPTNNVIAIDFLSARNFVIEANVFRFFFGATNQLAIKIDAACLNGNINNNIYSTENTGVTVVNNSTTTYNNTLLNGIYSLHLDTNTNFQVGGSGTVLYISNINDAGNAYNPMVLNASVIVASSPVRLPSYTVASLPAANSVGVGSIAFVTDATVTTFASVVAGGGSNKVPVYTDGTSWYIG
jgi:hypothetical protein